MLTQNLFRGNRKFSTIGLDHAHEQSNKILKQTVHGLNCDVQNLWTHAAPEIASILTQKDPVDIAPHHEDNASHDAIFFNDIKKLQARINECCNPFKESDTLIKLNSRAEVSHADQSAIIAFVHWKIEERNCMKSSINRDY